MTSKIEKKLVAKTLQNPVKLMFDWIFYETSANSSVTRSFWYEIATPMIENRHKIAPPKFFKIATFLEKIPTFVLKYDPPIFFIAFLCNNCFEKCDILGKFFQRNTSLSQSWHEVPFVLIIYPTKSGIYPKKTKICYFLL